MEALRGDELARILVYGLPAAAIVYGVMQVDARPSLWTYLGGASYTLYLTHPLVISPLLVFWLTFRPPFPELVIATGIAGSVLLAWRLHELFEKPLLRMMGKAVVTSP